MVDVPCVTHVASYTLRTLCSTPDHRRGQTDRQTYLTDRQTHRQTDRQAGREADRHPQVFPPWSVALLVTRPCVSPQYSPRACHYHPAGVQGVTLTALCPRQVLLVECRYLGSGIVAP